MSRIGTFIAFLERLKMEHCNGKCHYDATRCPIAKALSHDYPDFLWCPWCDSFKFPSERKERQGEGKLAKEVMRWLLGGNAGLIRGFLPDGHYKASFACKCEVGRHARIDGKPVKPYDFTESQDECFQKRLSDLIKRDAELAPQGQRSE